MNNYDVIAEFEKELSVFTGAPYVVMTDCCSHAIELCMIYEEVRYCEFPAYTYLSVPMTLLKLDIDFSVLESLVKSMGASSNYVWNSGVVATKVEIDWKVKLKKSLKKTK